MQWVLITRRNLQNSGFDLGKTLFVEHALMALVMALRAVKKGLTSACRVADHHGES